MHFFHCIDIEYEWVFDSIIWFNIGKSFFLYPCHIDNITLIQKIIWEWIWHNIFFFLVFFWKIESFRCNEWEWNIGKISQKQWEWMDGSSISQVSYKSDFYRFIIENDRKFFANSIEIKECLCWMFTRAIPSIDNRDTRILTRKKSISSIFGSYCNNISISWDNSDSIFKYFSFGLTWKCDISFWYNSSAKPEHCRLKWETSTSRRLIKECCKNMFIKYTTSSFWENLIHFLCLRHKIFEIISRKLFCTQYMFHRKNRVINCYFQKESTSTFGLFVKRSIFAGIVSVV